MLCGNGAVFKMDKEELWDTLKRPCSNNEIYARTGEWIVCERHNHPIAQVKHVVRAHDVFEPSTFHNWRQKEPSISDTENEIKCETCGSKWFRNELHHSVGTFLHFRNGWR